MDDEDEDEIRAALAAHKTEIDRLNGEVLALTNILFFTLFHVVRNSQDPIRLALGDAAKVVEDSAISAGKTVSPEHLVKALGIVEHFDRHIFPRTKK